MAKLEIPRRPRKRREIQRLTRQLPYPEAAQIVTSVNIGGGVKGMERYIIMSKKSAERRESNITTLRISQESK